MLSEEPGLRIRVLKVFSTAEEPCNPVGVG